MPGILPPLLLILATMLVLGPLGLCKGIPPGSAGRLSLLCALEIAAGSRQALTRCKCLLVFLHGLHGKLVGLLQL